jgi:hypothetical protein
MLIYSERKILLADCWWSVCSQKKVLLVGANRTGVCHSAHAGMVSSSPARATCGVVSRCALALAPPTTASPGDYGGKPEETSKSNSNSLAKNH